MPKCKFCGQEVANEVFEDNFEICINCIMMDSMSLGVKTTAFMCLIVLGGIIITNLFFIIGKFILYSDFEQNCIYFVPPLIVTIISGSFIILSIVILKFKFTKENQTPEYNLA